MGQGECLPPNIYEKVLFGETKTRLNNQRVLILREKKLLERLPIIDKFSEPDNLPGVWKKRRKWGKTAELDRGNQ